MATKGSKSIGGQIAHGFHHAAHTVGHEAEKVGHKIEDEANKVGHQAEHQAHKAGSALNKLDPIHKLDQAAHEVVDRIIDPAANAGKKLIEHAAAESVRDLKSLGHTIEKDVIKKLPELAEHAAREAIEKFAEAISEAGLKKFRKAVHGAKSKLDALGAKRERLTGALDNLSVYLELGPATLTWAGFYSRADAIVDILDTYIDKPPRFSRDDIMRLILAIGPTTINLGFSVSFALVIGSKELGIGGGFGDIELVLFTEIGDVILDDLGVPD